MSFLMPDRPQAPPPPALPDPLPNAPSYASGGTKPTGSRIGGFGSTLMTGGEGVDSSGTNVQRKTLLGQ